MDISRWIANRSGLKDTNFIITVAADNITNMDK